MAGKQRLRPIQLQVTEEFEIRARKWRENLSELMKDKGLTQKELARLLNDRYDKAGVKTSFTQKNVSEWLRVGDPIDAERDPHAGATVFPRYEVMIQIAAILGVDVGRLTGETDFDSFKAERTSEYLGLSNDAIRALRKIVTVFDNPFGEQYHADENVTFDLNAIELMNKLLTADGLIDTLVLMRRLDTIQKRLKTGSKAIERVEKRYEPALVKKAWFVHGHRSLTLEPYDQTIEQYWAENKQILREAGITPEELQTVLGIANELDAAIVNADEEDFTGEMVETAYRYQVQKSLSDLLDEMFPPDCS